MHYLNSLASSIIPGILPCASQDGGAVNCNNYPALIQTVSAGIDLLFRVAVMMATVSIAYAGFLYLTAGDDAGKVKKAHGIFGYVIQGFIVMCLAWLLVKLVLSIAGPDYSLLKS